MVFIVFIDFLKRYKYLRVLSVYVKFLLLLLQEIYFMTVEESKERIRVCIENASASGLDRKSIEEILDKFYPCENPKIEIHTPDISIVISGIKYVKKGVPVPALKTPEPELISAPEIEPRVEDSSVIIPIAVPEKKKRTRKPKETTPVETSSLINEPNISVSTPSVAPTASHVTQAQAVSQEPTREEIVARVAKLIRFYCQAQAVDRSLISIQFLNEKAPDIMEYKGKRVSDEILELAIIEVKK